MPYAIAIDVGGTFTDVTITDVAQARFWVAKTPTTPHAPVVGLMTGLHQALALAGSTPDDLRAVLHATTIATNEILEDKGAVTGLVTTKVFRYGLEIGRHDAPRSRNIHTWIKEKRPVPPELIVEVDERMGVDGTVRRPLDEAGCRTAAEYFAARGIRSIAICLLGSYANDRHEQRAREIILEVLPDADVSVSAEVLPVLREFERSMATVLNAYVTPAVGGHVRAVRGELDRGGVTGPLYIMKSNGGVVASDEVIAQPITTALSGPAAGVVGASVVGHASDEQNLITVDVGGTSADLCLIRDGEALVTTHGRVGSWPYALPMVDITTIGAGGGSIASVEGTRLRVGPESAGAAPGPACYGTGGTLPTVTDAHLALGRLPEQLIDGALTLDRELSLRAIHDHVANPLGISVTEAANGILSITDNAMVGAIRVMTVERGFDPTAAALLAFGGAGPLHAAAIGRALGVRSTVIPQNPGVLSALGLLGSNIRNDFVRSCFVRRPQSQPDVVLRALSDLITQANDWFAAQDIDVERRSLALFGEVRYENQRHELSVPVSVDHEPDLIGKRLAADFVAMHEQLYGYTSNTAEVELVTLHVVAGGALTRLEFPQLARTSGVPTPRETRRVYFPEVSGWVECPVYDRTSLRAGDALAGPLVIDQLDATVVVLPGQLATTDDVGTLIITEGTENRA